MLAHTMRSSSLVFLATAISVSRVRAASVLDLSSGLWELSNGNRSIVVHVEVPGYALQYLHEHKLIADPLQRWGSVDAY